MFWWKNPKRSKFGRWLDKEGITQVEFSEKSKVSRRTLTRLCNEKEYIPSPQILRKIMNVVKKVDNSKHTKDFFDI